MLRSKARRRARAHTLAALQHTLHTSCFSFCDVMCGSCNDLCVRQLQWLMCEVASMAYVCGSFNGLCDL